MANPASSFARSYSFSLNAHVAFAGRIYPNSELFPELALRVSTMNFSSYGGCYGDEKAKVG